MLGSYEKGQQVTNIRYVGSHDAVDVPGVGTVERGDYLSVPAAIAGTAPSGTDPGTGLLAQPTWEKVQGAPSVAAPGPQKTREAPAPPEPTKTKKKATKKAASGGSQ